MSSFVSAMPMYGPGEGYMSRLEMPSVEAAVIVAREMLKSGGFLFVEIEDDNGNIIVSEKELVALNRAA